MGETTGKWESWKLRSRIFLISAVAGGYLLLVLWMLRDYSESAVGVRWIFVCAFPMHVLGSLFNEFRRIDISGHSRKVLGFKRLGRDPILVPVDEVTSVTVGKRMLEIHSRRTRHFWNWRTRRVFRSQFRDKSDWEHFVSRLREVVPKRAFQDLSDYPPTFPETPCPGCGLKIPRFEERCPNCARPRLTVDTESGVRPRHSHLQ